MPSVEDHQSAIERLRQEIENTRSRARSLYTHGVSNAQKLDDYFRSLIQSNNAELAGRLSAVCVAGKSGWRDTAWQGWEAQSARDLSTLRYGEVVDPRLNGSFTFPAYHPFIGRNSTIIVRCGGQNVAQGESLLQSLLIRTALMLPHQVSYTLIDPAGNGKAFPMRKSLSHVSPNGDDVARDLDHVIAEIRRRIEAYLDAAVTSFDLVPEDVRINERFHFVFAADFPNRYDRRAIEKMQSIANTGPQAGVYLFIQHNQDHELPRDIGMDGFKNAFYITPQDTQLPWRGKLNLVIRPDLAPPPDVQERVFTELRNSTPRERIIKWDDVVGMAEENWWKADGSAVIETAIGKRGGNDLLSMWFGEDKEARPCAHGMLGAMTGAGKSSLYHSLIAGLVTRYSPEQLRLYLIDGKYGVEFKPYLHLPHAEVVSLNTSPELSRSVLAELISEMGRRNEIFARHDVRGLRGYREKGQPEGNMPRVLLIVDEYQQLFDGDRDGVASKMLSQISNQGRSAGIHMLLASQRFGAAGMLNQTAIFGNLHLRMAMQMAEADVRALTEFGPRGKSLILSTCNLPGKIVINDRAGDDNFNIPGKVAFLAEDRRNELLEKLEEKAAGLCEESLPRTVVFNGEAQPNLLENPNLVSLLRREQWPTMEELESIARRPVQNGGWNIPDWFVAERPSIGWLGQEFNVRGQASVVLRRRSGEHVCVLGSANTARYGMLAGMLASLAVSAPPQDVRFMISDRSIPGALWSGALQTACDALLRPAGFTVEFTGKDQETEKMLAQVADEISRRRTLGEDERAEQPTIIVMMAELDRVEALRRTADSFGFVDSPAGELLRRIYIEGSSLGIHLILSFTGVRPMLSIMDEKRGLVNFRHRIALQMSEDESFTFARSRKASQLQLDGPVPVCALYVDMENDKTVRFKPYSVEQARSAAEQSLQEQLIEMGTVLKERRTEL